MDTKYLFTAEVTKLQEVKEVIAKEAMAKMNPSVHTMARQCFDHLDAACLFAQQLGAYLPALDTAVEQAAAKAAAAGEIIGAK